MSRSKPKTAAEKRRRAAAESTLYPPMVLMENEHYLRGYEAGTKVAKTTTDEPVEFIIGVADGLQGRLTVEELELMAKIKNI